MRTTTSVWRTKRFAADLERLPAMLRYIAGAFGTLSGDPALCARMKVAAEEVLVNIISYAYPKEKGSIDIAWRAAADGSCFSLKISDEGVPYNPLQNAPPDLGAELEERQIGGLGVYLYKTIMDRVEYNAENGKNVLTLYKYLEKPRRRKSDGENRN